MMVKSLVLIFAKRTWASAKEYRDDKTKAVFTSMIATILLLVENNDNQPVMINKGNKTNNKDMNETTKIF